MSTKFKEVDLATIKQGEFMKECEGSFRQLQADFVQFIDENEVTAEAVLNMKVSLKYDLQKKAYTIIADSVTKLPKKPSSVTSAFAAEGEDGKMTLFAQASGTTKGDPRQQVLCTEKGETIDAKSDKAKN